MVTPCHMGHAMHAKVSLGAWVQDRIAFTSSTKSHLDRRTKSHLDPGLNGTWVQDRITFWSKTESHLGPGPIRFGSESHLGEGANCILNPRLNHLRVRDRIAFGSGTELHLGPGLNHICVQNQITLNPRLYPIRIWVPDQIISTEVRIGNRKKVGQKNK